ncbi:MULTISPECIES: hypothetical protein [Fischerella]|uniref:hypothetical protein n=1 Tax=Fischerella TaxID=1190 RepID=UPI000306F2F4|nr:MULTISPECIES: hypothetical protein [Fischerella]
MIPVTIRLYQADLLNLEPLRSQLNHDFAVNFGQEITEMVGIQLIDQMQDAIRQGELARWLFHPETRHENSYPFCHLPFGFGSPPSPETAKTGAASPSAFCLTLRTID